MGRRGENQVSDFGYSAGDKIYVFSRHGFYSGIVEKITKSGQVVVGRNGSKIRFGIRGFEVGSGGYGADYIKNKKDQDAAADQVRREVRRIKRRNEFTAEIDKIRAIDVRHDECVSEAVAALRALADKLESGSIGNT